ncbi:MAG: hypothetical protein AABY66_07140, partial [Nitrospirota bacterium]
VLQLLCKYFTLYSFHLAMSLRQNKDKLRGHCFIVQNPNIPAVQIVMLHHFPTSPLHTGKIKRLVS